MSDITERQARLMENYGPLEMARIIEAMENELRWLSEFATVRSLDDSKTFAIVNRGALRTIAERAAGAGQGRFLPHRKPDRVGG